MDLEVECILLIVFLGINAVALIINIITNILFVNPLKTLVESLNSLYLTVEDIDNELKEIRKKYKE